MRIVVGSTGGSGILYLLRFFYFVLSQEEVECLWIPSENFFRVIEIELGEKWDRKKITSSFLEQKIQEVFPEDPPFSFRAKFSILNYRDLSLPPASGSFLTHGMLILPCSLKTLAGISHGYTSNLIERAADVHLKEKRKLIAVIRETPYNLIHIENMKKFLQAGGILLPASPGFYHQPKRIEDLLDFIIDRIGIHLGFSRRILPPYS